LESQTIVNYAQNNCASADPSMHVRKYALATRLLEVIVLKSAQDGLKNDDCADNDQADDGVRIPGSYWESKITIIESESDSKAHATNHHNETKELDRSMDCGDLPLQVRIAQERDSVNG
jgi:hypothetical protein